MFTIYYGKRRHCGNVRGHRTFNLPYTVVDRVRGNPTVPNDDEWVQTIKRWLSKE